MNRKALVFYLLSLVIVAFGQPTWAVTLSCLSAVVGYGLFFLSIWQCSRKRRCLYAFFWFSIVSLVQLSWMSSSEYHGLYIWFVYFGIAFWLGAQFSFLVYFFPKNRAPTIGEIFALSALWTLIEWGRLFIFCGFPFNPAGLALSANLYSLQLASFAGVLGLSFWVMMTNLMFIRVLIGKARKAMLVSWQLLAVFPYLFGVVYLQYHEERKKHFDVYQVALIQTGLKPEQKVFSLSKLSEFMSPFDQWDRIISSLEGAEKGKLDFVVLPEAALPFGATAPIYPIEHVVNLFQETLKDFSIDSLPITEDLLVSNAYIAQTLANHYEAEWIVGLDDMVEDEASYNAAFHFIPHQSSTMRYEKQVLVPLAEYLPISFLKPIVKKYGISSFFTPGKEGVLFQGKARISPSICYEECFSHLMRKGKVLGANIFVNMTNDNYFPNSTLPRQHFDHALVRTVENGIPLIRACNTGVTAGVDSLGKIVGTLGDGGESEWKHGALFLSISSYHFKTPYSMWGDYFITLLCFACLGIFFLKTLRRKNKRLL